MMTILHATPAPWELINQIQHIYMLDVGPAQSGLQQLWKVYHQESPVIVRELLKTTKLRHKLSSWTALLLNFINFAKSIFCHHKLAMLQQTDVSKRQHHIYEDQKWHYCHSEQG